MPDAPRLRGEARDEALRARIEPLAPGERPRPLVAAAALCAGLAVANGAIAATGYEAETGGGAFLPVLALLLLVLAVGLWRADYWAALAFQGVCAITSIYAFLSLLVASNLAAATLSVVMLAVSGVLFWLMVRVMSRIQAPPK